MKDYIYIYSWQENDKETNITFSTILNGHSSGRLSAYRLLLFGILQNILTEPRGTQCNKLRVRI